MMGLNCTWYKVHSDTCYAVSGLLQTQVQHLTPGVQLHALLHWFEMDCVTVQLRLYSKAASLCRLQSQLAHAKPTEAGLLAPSE